MIRRNSVLIPDGTIFTPQDIYGRLGAIALTAANRPRILGVAIKQEGNLVAVINTSGYAVFKEEDINRSHDCRQLGLYYQSA
ncbi:MAG: hypothetical protein AABX25_01470 [Nanoarchaeota archaeon]